ncbi:MAG: hypothetical protein JJT76_03105 [Clostridiaceae bacterium]|nr:hypothetical protein [Clostridiaceae bacterium]
MKFKVGDIIEAQGNLGYIDFEGKIKIVTITDFNKASEYQDDFFDWWFGEKDAHYKQCKKMIEKVYIGIYLEENHFAGKGKVMAFPEEFLDLKRTRIVRKKSRGRGGTLDAKNSSCKRSKRFKPTTRGSGCGEGTCHNSRYRVWRRKNSR